MEFFPRENVEFLTALGRFTVRFAAAETGLDVCNALIFHFCEGRTVEPKIPRFLERKLAFFSTCQNRCTKLATADPRFRELERIPLRFEHSLHGERSSCTLLPRNRPRSVRSGAIDAEWCARRPCAGQPLLC